MYEFGFGCKITPFVLDFGPHTGQRWPQTGQCSILGVFTVAK